MSENNAVNVPMGNVVAALKQFLVEKSGSQWKIAKDFGIPRRRAIVVENRWKVPF